MPSVRVPSSSTASCPQSLLPKTSLSSCLKCSPSPDPFPYRLLHFILGAVKTVLIILLKNSLFASLGIIQKGYGSPHCPGFDFLVLDLDHGSAYLSRLTLCSLKLAQNQQISGKGRLIRFRAAGSRWLSRPS